MNQTWSPCLLSWNQYGINILVQAYRMSSSHCYWLQSNHSLLYRQPLLIWCSILVGSLCSCGCCLMDVASRTSTSCTIYMISSARCVWKQLTNWNTYKLHHLPLIVSLHPNNWVFVLGMSSVYVTGFEKTCQLRTPNYLEKLNWIIHDSKCIIFPEGRKLQACNLPHNYI